MHSISRTIQSALDQFVEEGSERGVQVAIYIQGELAVNAFAGIADPGTGREVDCETLFPVFSTTKGMAATLLHLLVGRGQVLYDTPIAEVWPEFAAHGKGGITLRHALEHTSGIPNMPLGITHAELCDWDAMCRAIADLHPLSAPGSVMAYHAITYGWIIGEVARRVDGRSFQRLLQEEIAAPLGLSGSIYVGIPDEVEPLVAILEAKEEKSGNTALPDDSVPQAIPSLVHPLHEWMNRPDARRACLPASTGIMTAHAIARHYAALLPGGVDGVELLPPERIRLATELPGGRQYPPGEPLPRQRLGYTVGNPFSATAFGNGGHGGSIGFADRERRLAFGFTRNRFVSDTSLPQIIELLHQELGMTSAQGT